MKYRRVKLPNRKVWSVTEAYALYNEAGDFLGELWHSPPVEVKEPGPDAGTHSWVNYAYKVMNNPNLWFGIPPEACEEDHDFPPQYGDGHRWIDAADALAEGRTETHKWLEYKRKHMSNGPK